MTRLNPLSAPSRLRERRHQRSRRLLASRAVAETLVSVAGLNGRPVRNPSGAEIGTVRDVVARWDGGDMILRWLAVALIEASKTFRKLRGHKGMPKLVAALRAHDRKLKPATVDASAEAA